MIPFNSRINSPYIYTQSFNIDESEFQHVKNCPFSLTEELIKLSAVFCKAVWSCQPFLSMPVTHISPVGGPNIHCIWGESFR